MDDQESSNVDSGPSNIARLPVGDELDVVELTGEEVYFSTESGTLDGPRYTEPVWLVPPVRDAITADEDIVGLGAKVQDFWRFALGDLRMNNARGYLAEFIGARALGLDNVRRTEWDAYDILWGDITIEVKSSAYLQSWDQRRISQIHFGGLKGTRWHPRHDLDPVGKRNNAMVYVFCVQTSRRPETTRAMTSSNSTSGLST